MTLRMFQFSYRQLPLFFGDKQGPTTTQNTSQTATIPPQITAQQNYYRELVNALTAPTFMQGVPNYSVMGVTPNQMLAGDLGRLAGQFSSNQLMNPPNFLGGPSIAAQQSTAQQSTPMFASMSAAQQAAAQQATAAQAAAAQAQAQQLAPGEIAPFMNPYIDTALNPVLERLKKQQAEVQSGIGASAAASHMYGGSREAVMRMLADRNYRDTLGTTAGNMLHAGWQVASGLASQNADRRQQTALTNAQLQNAINSLNAQLSTQTSGLNAQLGTQASMTNAQLANQLAALNAQLATQSSMQNAQLGTQSNMQNAQLGTQASIADANRYIQALQAQGQFGNQAIQNQLNTAMLMSQLGGQERAIGQQVLDAPYTQLARLLTATPWTVPTSTTGTQTATQTQPVDTGSVILGLLGTLGRFSDRRLKENIERIDTLPNGLPVYSFNFIGSDMPLIGLMSDDVRKIRPDAVRVVDGYDVVDYAMAVR